MKFWQNEKNLPDIIILHKCTLNGKHWCMVPEIWSVTDRIACYFGPFFTLLAHLKTPQKSKYWKNGKNDWRYHFTQVYQKSWSYAILFLRYGAWFMSFIISILGYLPFSPPNSSKNQNLKKWKKALGDIVVSHIQGGPQKCLDFSLAITFTKIRKPLRFFLHSYWKFIEFFYWKPLYNQ